MQFVFHQNASEPRVTIEGELFIHLFKARRTTLKSTLALRNMKDEYLYHYLCTQITRKEAIVELKDSIFKPLKPRYPLHLILASIDPKSLQKSLPILNALGTEKITLFRANFSQGCHKIDKEKLQKIAIFSSQQCGRSDYLQIEERGCLKEVLENYPDSLVFDFNGKSLLTYTPPSYHLESTQAPTIIIGPEGGFSSKEREIASKQQIISTGESIILTSETAAIYLQANARNFYGK